MIVFAIPVALGLTLNTQAQASALGAFAMGVVPFQHDEPCLDKGSIHRGPDGLTYFSLVACGPNVPRTIDEYRLSCRQDRDGPWAYERKIDGSWIALTAQPYDEIGQVVAKVCAFPKHLPKGPPHPKF